MLAEGAVVVVVAMYDDTAVEANLGRLGIVKQRLPYQGIGDDPKKDPLWEVLHASSFGRPGGRHIYWTEELAEVPIESMRDLAVVASDAALELDGRHRGASTKDAETLRLADYIASDLPKDVLLLVVRSACGDVGTIDEARSCASVFAARLREPDDVARLRDSCVSLSRMALARTPRP